MSPNANPHATLLPAETFLELTAAGRGAISVIAVKGIDLASRLDNNFQPFNKKCLTGQSRFRPIYGNWGAEDIVLWLSDEGYAEIQCHGGEFAKQQIVQDLQTLGFEQWQVDKEEQTCDESSLAMQAYAELAKTTTKKTAAVLTWQCEGALDQAFLEIDSNLAAGQKKDARQQIEEVLNFAEFGMRLTTPWKIAIAGAANAGKSSLINQIVGYSRSIVMDMPGTTRDLVTVDTAIDGWPVQLIDTAGLRNSNDQIEQAGMELANSAIESSDLVVEVLDALDPRPEISANNLIQVMNKCDLKEPIDSFGGPRLVALTGDGVEALLHSIASKLIPNQPVAGQAIPFLQVHIDKLRLRLAEATTRD